MTFSSLFRIGCLARQNEALLAGDTPEALMIVRPLHVGQLSSRQNQDHERGERETSFDRQPLPSAIRTDLLSREDEKNLAFEWLPFVNGVSRRALGLSTPSNSENTAVCMTFPRRADSRFFTTRDVSDGLGRFLRVLQTRDRAPRLIPDTERVRPKSSGLEWRAIGMNNTASILEMSRAREAASTSRCGMG